MAMLLVVVGSNNKPSYLYSETSKEKKDDEATNYY
jgi:hypothetical protein